MTFNQGDIILIPFPFTDFSTFKQRPAFVISSPAFNRTHNDIIALAITSQIPKSILPEEYLKILIRRRLGQLSPTSIEKVKNKLRGIF